MGCAALHEYSSAQLNSCLRTASKLVAARALSHGREAGAESAATCGCLAGAEVRCLLYSSTSRLYCCTRWARVLTTSLHFLLCRCLSLGVAARHNDVTLWGALEVMCYVHGGAAHPTPVVEGRMIGQACKHSKHGQQVICSYAS